MQAEPIKRSSKCPDLVDLKIISNSDLFKDLFDDKSLMFDSKWISSGRTFIVFFNNIIKHEYIVNLNADKIEIEYSNSFTSDENSVMYPELKAPYAWQFKEIFNSFSRYGELYWFYNNKLNIVISDEGGHTSYYVTFEGSKPFFENYSNLMY